MVKVEDIFEVIQHWPDVWMQPIVEKPSQTSPQAQTIEVCEGSGKKDTTEQPE
jgi:hypothetical protein